MLEKRFRKVYLKFKMNFYMKVFSVFEEREASLTTIETFCAEIIHAMKNPTINEFANLTNISAQNATHRINSLVRKGYVEKIRSSDDRREYRLSVTDKFFLYYDMSNAYMSKVIDRMADRFSEEEMRVLTRILTVMDEELMPEVAIANEDI